MQELDLGNERLILTMSFGPDIEARLSREETPAFTAAREHLLTAPNRHIIGGKIGPGGNEGTLRNLINQQMGLPHGSSWSDLKDRVVGRELDFFALVVGYGHLGLIEKFKLRLGLIVLGVRHAIDE